MCSSPREGNVQVSSAPKEPALEAVYASPHGPRRPGEEGRRRGSGDRGGLLDGVGARGTARFVQPILLPVPDHPRCTEDAGKEVPCAEARDPDRVGAPVPPLLISLGASQGDHEHKHESRGRLDPSKNHYKKKTPSSLTDRRGVLCEKRTTTRGWRDEVAAPDVGGSSVSVPPSSTRTRELVSQTGLGLWPLCLDSDFL